MAEPSTLGEIKNLTGKAAIYGLGSTLLRSLSFFLLPITTRFLTPNDYGILALTSSLTSVLGVLLSLSLHGALNPIYFGSSNEAEKRANLGTVWVAITLLALSITFALDRAGDHLFPLLFTNVPFSPYIRLAIWSLFLTTLGLVPFTLLQMQERAGWFVFLTGSSGLLQIGLVLYFVVFQRLGAQGSLLGSFWAALLMSAPLVLLTFRNIKPTFRLSVIKMALAYSLPLVPHSLASWVLELSDRAILERFVSLDQLGLYSLGYTYGTVMSMIATAINAAWVPFLFKTDAKEGENARYRFARLVTYLTLFLCFAALGLGLFAKEIMALMTAPAFHGASEVAPWIVAGWLLSGLYYFPINFLFLKRKTKLVPVVTVVSGLCNVGLNLWLAPRYGIMSAAWATFASYGLMLLLAWWLGRQVYCLPYEYGRLAKIAIVTLVLWLAGNISIFSIGWAIFFKAFLLVAFPLILLGIGFLVPAERQRAHAVGASFWHKTSETRNIKNRSL